MDKTPLSKYFYKLNQHAGFSLVDSDGNTVGPEELGLLLWNGGTVCNYRFNNNSADAICRVLGYKHHYRWTSGEKWEIQSVLNIHINNIECVSGDWSSCTYSEISPRYCGHSEDVFLLCSGKLKILTSFISKVKTSV